MTHLNVVESQTLLKTLAKWRRNKPAPQDLKVNCGGRRHTLRLDERGRLILVDHTPEQNQREFALHSRWAGLPLRKRTDALVPTFP